MSSLDEAYLTPLQNSNGVFKPLSGNRRNDFVQIIADLMEFMFNCHFQSQLKDRYGRRLSEDDRIQYEKTAFRIGSEGDKHLRDGFRMALHKAISKKGLLMTRVVLRRSKYQGVYYELSNEYFKRVVGIGPYRNPVWLLEDE